MFYESGDYFLFASDVSTFLACKHATQLHKQYLVEGKGIPHRNDPVLDALIQRGAEHEQAYVAYLRKQGFTCTDNRKKTHAETIEAMANGVDAIIQGRLENGNWAGFPDTLIRVEGKSRFGDWQYEVLDTKLSTNTRTGTIIQLCFYSELLDGIQDVQPVNFSVITPGNPFAQETYRFSDFDAYYRFVKKNFKIAIQSSPVTYPEPVEHCNICNWWHVCDERRRTDDHLSFVAGLRKTQMKDLKNQGLLTLEAFALAENLQQPKRGSSATLLKRKKQAEIQYEARVKKSLLHEILPVVTNLGFNKLPIPSPGDIYLDIEGDAFFLGGSMEYLFGLLMVEEEVPRYVDFWAKNRSEEKQAFMSVMKFILERMRTYPDLSIYHYGHYEPSTFKRLAHIYSAYELEIDDLVRQARFVDLHLVVKDGLIASVERYSLKDMEKLAGYVRKVDLREASYSRKQFERSLQLGELKSLPATTVETIRGYNEDDCVATQALHQWLESEKKALIDRGERIPGPTVIESEADKETTELETRSRLVFDSLTSKLPPDSETWIDEEKAKWLLANLLQYFRRENKSAWWEHFRLQKAEYDDLNEEKRALAGLTFQKQIQTSDQIPIHQYSFPEQVSNVKNGDQVYVVNSIDKENPFGVSLGTVKNIDYDKQLVEIKKTAKTSNVHPQAIHDFDIVPIAKLWRAILSIATDIDEDGLEHKGQFCPAKDLLMSRPPQLILGGEVRVEATEKITDCASRIALNLNRSILPIQGPPGTGKTYTGAHIIIALIKANKTVGVTAVSHRVITTLFEETHEQALKEHVSIAFFHRVSEKQRMPQWIKQITNKGKAREAIGKNAIMGGTAWQWADDDFRDSIDYLIVDEAGQMSLSQVLAASRACKNLILLGDPQQLQQPQKGAHPEGSDIAALTHLLDGKKVIPAGKGLFLNVTRRLNPSIAKFTSEVFYEGQLETDAGLDKQKVSGGTLFDGDGLFLVPVAHNGNQYQSDEEVDAIKTIVDNLLQFGSWSDKDGTYKITNGDILVVAPYNVQVDALQVELKDIDVGTVDKFQGRQAPVVIYSMTASTVADAPHGMDFLFNSHRLNVATSRAKCACIMVASSTLFEVECNSIEQMRSANAICRYAELSRLVEL